MPGIEEMPGKEGRRDCLPGGQIMNTDLDMKRTCEKPTRKLSIADSVNSSSPTIQAALLDAIIARKGLQHIIDIVHELLGNPLLLVDPAYKLLACSRNISVDDPVWNELVTQGYCSYDFIALFKAEKILEPFAKSSTPYILDWSVGKKIRRICAKIVIDQKVAGYYVAFESQRPFAESDIEITTLICDVIASEMRKYGYLYGEKNAAYENFIVDILDNKILDPDIFSERVKYLDWKMNENNFLLSVKLDHYDRTHSLAPYMKEALQEILPDVKAAVYRGYIVAIIELGKEGALQKEAHQKLVNFLKKHKIRAGVSQCFHDLSNLQKYFKQSVDCLKVGYKLNKNETLYLFEEYSIHIMLSQCARHQDITDFCHPCLLKLAAYDRSNKTNYVQTLYTYLLHTRNLVSAANALFIHRNTLSYRIAKIQKITGIDFDNDNLLMQLYMSYKILEFTGKL